MIYKQTILYYLFLANFLLMLAKSIGFLNVFRRRFIQQTSVTYITNSSLDLTDKHIITLSPGGLKGFYMMGVCKYIKDNYDLTNFVFSGASAGAWNSLLLCFKGDIRDFQRDILDMHSICDLKTIEYIIKMRILERYNEDDFELDKLYIGTTVYERFQLKTVVYTGFENLQDALECCIASSHIPFITGGGRYRYRGLASFDGGFSEFPYLNNRYSNLHITPSIWSDCKTIGEKLAAPNVKISDLTTLFSKNDYDMKELIDKGFADAKMNKKTLDEIFLHV